VINSVRLRCTKKLINYDCLVGLEEIWETAGLQEYVDNISNSINYFDILQLGIFALDFCIQVFVKQESTLWLASSSFVPAPCVIIEIFVIRLVRIIRFVHVSTSNKSSTHY
jgi:hypothetical protein